MSAKKWSFEEEAMIKNGLTNSEIASLTGRTEKSVQMKRYRMTGLCDAPPREVEGVTEKKKKEYRHFKKSF